MIKRSAKKARARAAAYGYLGAPPREGIGKPAGPKQLLSERVRSGIVASQRFSLPVSFQQSPRPQRDFVHLLRAEGEFFF